MGDENKVIPVKVSLRCRPLIEKENAEGCQVCLQFVNNEPQVLIGKNKAFTYDYVFNQAHSQEQVYEVSVKGLVDNIFKGYNATVLAYGQTGSGKTFTMGGGYQDSLNGDEMLMGVIPRVVRDLFKGIDSKSDYSFDVKVSYLEIYNEELIDLLTAPARRESIQIREDTNGGIKLQGMQEVGVGSYEDTMHLLEKGSKGRTTGATAMNNTSSRSHAIFTIHIDQTSHADQNDLCHVKFHLVDLAGSERAKRTKAKGERFKEGVNINMGLLALGNVISALGEDGEKRSHIPYRDSKLTRILQDSLGGNSHTVMVACVSPADSNMEETLNTLRYADRARKIKNKPIVNRDPQAAEILRLKQIVQQLRLQLVDGGNPITLSAIKDIGETTTVQNNSVKPDELKKWQDKSKDLIEENTKLSRELENSVDQITRMCERIISLETQLENLKEKIKELQQQSGVNLEILSSSINTDANPAAKEQLEKIKTLTDSIQNVEAEEPAQETEFEETSNKDQDMDCDEIPSTPQSNAISTQYALRQAMMGRELQELNRLLEKKQELAHQMSNNDNKMESMRQQYETTTKQLEDEIANLQKERESLQTLLRDSKANGAAQKVSEQRRMRLKELEQQMSGLKKKLSEQGKIVKLKNQSDKQVLKLNQDIQGLKQQRVKLMKQMKEDAEQFRKWKQEKDKEVMQLMQKDRKRQCEIAKLQRDNEKQQAVLKRKAEEAAAANRRLKEAVAKHKAVMTDRSKKLEKYDSSDIGNRVRQWLNHELDVRVSVREAKYHLNSLLTDRKTLTGQLQHLQKTLEEGPRKKRLAWTGKGESFEKSMEIEDIENQVSSLKREIELRNAQITDLQEKILDAEQDRKEKDTYSNIHTMVEAKCAMKYLLEQAVGAKADISVAKGELNEVKGNFQEVSELRNKYEKEVKQVKQDYDQQVTEMQRKYENKILFLLHQPKSEKEKVNNQSLEDATRKRLEFQEKEIERLSELNEQLDKKKEECEILRKQLTLVAYHDRRVSYLPMITSPGGSPITPHIALKETDLKKEKKIVTKSAVDLKEDVAVEYDEWCETEEEESDENEDDPKDPAWRLTPHIQKFKRVIQRSNESDDNEVSKCSCRGTCATKRCSCKKLDATCGKKCKCSSLACENRSSKRPEDPEDDSQMTLNSTFSLSEKDTTAVNETSSESRKRSVLGLLQTPLEDSSEDFSSPKDDSIDIMEGGLKKKRKLLSQNSSSFFSPIIN